MMAYAGHFKSILMFSNNQVNKLVSEEIIKYKGTDNKQMSHFDSSLTRLLYFFPTPEGEHRQDWNIPPDQSEANTQALPVSLAQ